MMGNPVFVDTMNSLGGNGVAMGFDQLVNAHADRRRRRRGEQRAELRDAASTTATPSTTRMTGHLIIPEILVFSKRTWETLSKDDQALIMKARQGGAAGAAQALVRDGEEVRSTKMKEAGVEINDVADKQAVPGGGEAGVGQVRRPARGAHPAHPGREVKRQRPLTQGRPIPDADSAGPCAVGGGTADEGAIHPRDGCASSRLPVRGRRCASSSSRSSSRTACSRATCSTAPRPGPSRWRCC